MALDRLRRFRAISFSHRHFPQLSSKFAENLSRHQLSQLRLRVCQIDNLEKRTSTGLTCLKFHLSLSMGANHTLPAKLARRMLLDFLRCAATELHYFDFGLLPHGREADMTTNDVTTNEETTEPKMPSQVIVKRLAAAEGYLELGLPSYALVELSRVNDAGAFAPIAELFRGEALQAQEKYADAIEPLNRAAHMFPAPYNQRALLALSNCYRKDGQIALADETAAAVEMPPDVPKDAKLVIASIFHITKNPNRRSAVVQEEQELEEEQ